MSSDSPPSHDALSHSSSLSTRDLEDDATYSSWSNRTPEKSRRRYVSVDHALNWLCHLSHPGAIDTAALASPRGGSVDPDSFIVDQGEQAALALAFEEAFRRAGEDRARVWAEVRLHQATHRSFEGYSKTRVGQIVGEVDGLIAEVLKERGRWVGSYITPKRHAREPEYGKEEVA